MATPFDPNKVTVTLTGLNLSHIITGFANDTFVSLVWDNDLWNDTPDLSGRLLKFKTNNYSAKLTLTLSQASPSNDVLSNFMNLDRAIDIGGAFAIMIKDNNGSTLVTSPSAWVLNPPNLVYGTSATNRDWVIRMEDTNGFIGGINV